MKSNYLLFGIILVSAWNWSACGSAQQAALKAQVVSPGIPLQQLDRQPAAIVPQSVSAQSPSVAAPATGSAAQEPTPEETRVQLLLASQFDRSTAAVLKAWNEQPADASAHSDANSPPASEAVVRTVYEDFAVLEFKQPPEFKAGESVLLALEQHELGQWKLLSIDGIKVSVQKVNAEPVEPGTPQSEPESSQDLDVEKAANTKSDAAADEPVTTTVDPDNQPKPEASAESSSEPSTEPSRLINVDEQMEVGDSIAVRAAPATKLVEADVQKRAQKEVDAFVRNVTLGHWSDVKLFLSAMKPENGRKVYEHLLKSLANPSPAQPQVQGQLPITSYLTPDDVLQLIEASPVEFRIELQVDKDEVTAVGDQTESWDFKVDDAGQVGALVIQGGNMILTTPTVAVEQNVAGTPAEGSKAADLIQLLSRLIRNGRSQGQDFSRFFEQIKIGNRHFGGNQPERRLAAAELMMVSGLTQYVEAFLPALEDEATRSNIPALRIWSTYALAMHAKKQVADWLQKAWTINQWILSNDNLDQVDKDKSLHNLIELSAKVEQEIGVVWVNKSFSEYPDRGMTILANLGSQSAQLALTANQTPEDKRFRLLRLQNEAVEKLLAVSPQRAQQWRQTLTLLANNWLKEAGISLTHSQQSSRQSYMQIDMYGNYYWVDQNQWQQQHAGGNRPRPIKLGDILEIAPGQQWQELVDSSLHIHLLKTMADLHLRINEEDKAFPFIETIAASHPETARELVHEFLKIWTQNHDPNNDKRQRNPYIYFYGFDQKADAIPLTRSKQERNLQELASWVTRIRAMPIEEIDESLLAGAFTTCHSSAEVFQIERFASVFGDLKLLKPATVAALCNKMRSNLADQWRSVRNQEQKQTNRREPEVQQEVLRGYQVGLDLAEQGLAAARDSWDLQLAKAALMYDQNAYRQSVQKSSEFSDRRDAAFEQFQLAADKYHSVVSTLEQKDQSTDVFDYWFYAALGACDLGKITDKTVPDPRQYPLVRDAILNLPGALAEQHMAKFANNLFSRMSPIAPEIKFRYLRGGFEIVGDHPRAWEARNLFDYYQDLVSEIEFSVEVDGPDVVGSKHPFGAYVNILHTAEIERESGGFGKYVQNQTMAYWAYNYGRPNEDYRDKFEEAVETGLAEHFEVLNVTFQSPDSMASRPATKPGWRVTPYAYVLLKPKGPEIDRLPSLKLDMDFLDTSGYVIIPIESPAIVLDCSADIGPMRPIQDLRFTQTLDERQAADGKLIVEISASGKGLVPELDRILDLRQEGFELVSIDDQGVLPTTFEPDSDEIQILSDRSWTVEYEVAPGQTNPHQFVFNEPKLAGTQAKYQRYDDANLVEVAKAVQLEKRYAAPRWSFLYWLLPLVAVGLCAVAGVNYFVRRPATEQVKRFVMPEEINPFTVLTLLQDIKARNGIGSEQGLELQEFIAKIERYYFGESPAEKPEDLSKIAERWIQRAS